MSARKLEAYEFEQTPESKQTPLYQDYTPEAPFGPNLKEILFFVNIACFCIFMALFSFILVLLPTSFLVIKKDSYITVFFIYSYVLKEIE